MRSDIKATALVISATLAAACSSPPRTAQAAVETAAHPPSTTQTLAAASGEHAAGGVPAGYVDAGLVKEGYSVQRNHDQVLYCRTQVITGNRIATRVCQTAAQIQTQKHEVMKAKDTMNGTPSRCVGNTCNN